MELINSTKMVTGFTLGVEPGGRELLVVVIKGTFKIPGNSGNRLTLDEPQVPLILSDVYHGEPGLSSPKYEVDFAPRKGLCDILLNGSAYAPSGRSVARTSVGLRIGGWFKEFQVVGDRFWYHAGGVRASEPDPFHRMTISYDRAFGGVDAQNPDPTLRAAYMANPSGVGFHRHADSKLLEGMPLPNTEETGVPIDRPDGEFRPMAFGGIGRHWDPRRGYAGTYDQAWRTNVFPFLPLDFDERYYQAAPPDQQLTMPVGEQTVSLVNLTPDGFRKFTLPHFEAPVVIFPRNGGQEQLRGYADTILIEPDLHRVTITWRCFRFLKKNLFEIAEVLVGRRGHEWWQQREPAKFPVDVVVEPIRSKIDGSRQ